MIGHLDDVIRPLVFIIPRINGYVKALVIINMSFCIDDDKPLEEYKAIWTKIEELKNVKLSA